MQEDNNALDVRTDAEAAEKHAVVGVRFRPCGKIYSFEAENIDCLPGTKVVVESEMGVSIGTVATLKHTMEKPEEPLKKVIRTANEKDFETVQQNRAFQEEARTFCQNRVKELNLSMKVITTETTLDRKRLIFYFTADSRIDFRELVRDLAARFKTRIEMRQIGVRDEVKLLGGIGVCGRQTCCNLFLTNFEPVTIKMAKQQELSINQSKLSGICGRLMCCLGYECKESAGEKESAEVREEEFTGVSEEYSGTNLREADSGAVALEASQVRSEQPAAEGKMPAGNEHGEQRGKEQTAASPAERDAQGRRHSRRRHRHRRHMSDKPVNETPSTPSQQAPAQKPEGEEKGKAFSRRRKFWKKKKH
jgi:cell fate regulator YaaT (PSP1 superfamily)